MLRTRLAKLMEAGARPGRGARRFHRLLIRCGSPALPVYKVDRGLLSLLAQLLAHEKQAAEELGRCEKHEVTVKDELAKRLLAARARKAAREKAGA